MQTMNMALDRFAKAGVISQEQAMENSSIRSELRQMLRLTAEPPRNDTVEDEE
jgi:Tfp pilus assembly ATPase PilU